MARAPRSWIPTLALLLGCNDEPSVMESTSTASGGGSTEGGSTGGTDPVQCESGGWGEGEGDEGAEDTGFGMGDDMPLPFTIYEVQQGDAPSGARIVLSGVVVTTPAARGEVLSGYELFVQEQAGGAWSGLRIHTAGFDPGTVLAVGDAADVVGEVSRSEGYVLLEIGSSDDLTVTGTGVVPEPTVVEAAELLPGSAMARSYEGVLVRVQEATVTDEDPCDGEFELEDAARVDDRFVPDALPSPALGQVVAAVEGVLVYASDGYELAPPDGASVDE